MDKTDLPMLADKRIESNNFTELKLVLKNLNVRLSKNFRHTKLILGPISRCDSVQACDALNRTFFRVMPLFCGFCEKAQLQKPNKQNTFISFLLFLALNRSDIMMNFIDCFNCFKLRTFTLIVYAHPYSSRNSYRNATPRHASSACAEETFQPHIG